MVLIAGLAAFLAGATGIVYRPPRSGGRRGTKILMRSAGLDVSFLPESARAAVRLCPEVTAPLHEQDRVGTYASLHPAEVL